MDAGNKLLQAALMVIWGFLVTLTSPLAAITMSDVLLLATPLLLPGRTHFSDPEPAARNWREPGRTAADLR